MDNPFKQEEVDLLNYWILERENVRVLKEQNQPKPWTKDAMLQQFRFCNVHREDDKVTVWIRKNWREPFDGHPNMYIAMIMARLINWPSALEEIGFPKVWNYKRYLNALRARKSRGDQIWTGAYMVTAGGRPVPKEEAVCDMIHGFHRSNYRPQPGDTLLSVWEGLQNQRVPGMGSFLSAQVVADLKFTSLLPEELTPDWWTFCAPGPGSQIGLNHLLGEKLSKQWDRTLFEQMINLLRPLLPLELSAQDTQNCLCEFQKYKRGFSRSKYPGAQ